MLPTKTTIDLRFVSDRVYVRSVGIQEDGANELNDGKTRKITGTRPTP